MDIGLKAMAHIRFILTLLRSTSIHSTDVTGKFMCDCKHVILARNDGGGFSKVYDSLVPSMNILCILHLSGIISFSFFYTDLQQCSKHLIVWISTKLKELTECRKGAL